MPQRVTGLDGVVRIAAANGHHSLALRNDGTVWAWGNGSWGQLGSGGTGFALRPQQVPDLAGVARISAGGTHNLALLGDGTMRVRGDNIYGQLGNGTTGSYSGQPVRP